ncbi:MAG: SpoIIE family protein phosphatase [Treponema sp.]|nr:SpoIIE family protein phosphatase [Treponema sp.]
MIISLRIKILAIVLAFLSLVCAAFIIYSITTTRDLKDLRLQGIRKTVEYEAEKINKVISEIEQAAVFYIFASKVYNETQRDQLSEMLAVEYLKRIPSAIGGGFWYEPYMYRNNKLRAGFYAYFDSEQGVVRLDDSFFIDEYDYHSMPWYREITESAKKSYSVIWTKPYTDDSGSYTLMTTAGASLFNENDELTAISTVDWEISEIISQLNDIKPTVNSFILLCVPENDYVISSTYKGVNAGDSVLNLPWKIDSSHFNLNGIDYLGFNKSLDNNWFLSILIPENEIFEEVERRNGRYSFIILFSTIFMLYAAFLLISAFINKPIKKFTSDVANIALGNLDEKIIIYSNDELGQLAKTFNNMTSELKNSIDENVREREEKKRISTELSVAHDIQISMLPRTFPAFPDRNEFDLYASMIPARNVGGDFYDFFMIDNDNLAVVIADVSGKGVPAALFMVITKILIKNSSFKREPKEVFEYVNQKLCDNNELGMFVTAFMGYYNIPTGKFTFVNAGHNPPVIRKKDGIKSGTYEFIKTNPCIVLGFINEAEYFQEEITLDKGDVLFLYTDGITEALNVNNELYGEERLIQSLNDCSSTFSKNIINRIFEEVNKFEEGAEQADDITMLVLAVNDNKEKELIVDAVLENIDIIFEFLNADLSKYDYSQQFINEINIAAEEIFINIASYAYNDDETYKKVSIFTVITNKKVIIRFEDTGKSYNPLEQEEPDLDKDLLEREIGGLGIHMVKNLMDSIEYEQKDGRNILTIERKHP